MEVLQAAVTLEMYDGSRESFFTSTIQKTCEAYGNDPDDEWFVEAVRHRIIDSGILIVSKMYGQLTGYIGVDLLPEPSPIAYVGIATVFEEHKREGILQALFEPLKQYDGLLIRTQNPTVAYAVYRKYGMVMPLTEKPSEAAIIAGQTLYHSENTAYPNGCLPYEYDPRTMVAKGIYNGRRLTTKYKPRSSNTWFNRAIDAIVNADKGDAVCLFASERKHLTS